MQLAVGLARDALQLTMSLKAQLRRSPFTRHCWLLLTRSFVAITFALPFILSANESAEEFARLALDATLEGHLEHAAIFAKHALRIDPMNADVQMASGVLHWTRTIGLGEALHHQALLDPTMRSAAARGVQQQYADEASAAVTAFKRCIALSPWDASAADALKAILRHVQHHDNAGAGAEARLRGEVRASEYVSGPTRHRRHRSLAGSSTATDEAAPNAAYSGLDAWLPVVPPLTGDVVADAKVLWDVGYKQKAVDTLCTNTGVRISVPPHERNISTGAMPPDLSLDLSIVLQVCGFVLVQGSMPVSFVQFLKEKNDVSGKAKCIATATKHPLLCRAEVLL